MLHNLEKVTLVTCSCSAATDTTLNLHALVVYIKGWTWTLSLPYLVNISFFISVCKNFAFIKWSEFILLPTSIFKYLHFNWELHEKLFSDTHSSCLCVDKNEVALLYNWLQMFRLPTSAWNTEEQNHVRIHCGWTVLK
jgi:hypothetical protein